MATPNRCVYCLHALKSADMTVDHVIARSWYPGSTPDNVEKWKAPACRACNNRFSRDEQDLFIRLAHCVNPHDPAAQEVLDRAKRALDPSKAKNSRDRLRRQSARNRFIREMREVDALPSEGVLPSFRPNYDLGSRMALLVRAKLVSGVIEKWTRGLHYVLLGYPIPESALLTPIHMEDHHGDAALARFGMQATVLQAGPGIEVKHLTAAEGSARESVYAYRIWGQFRAYATVEE